MAAEAVLAPSGLVGINQQMHGAEWTMCGMVIFPHCGLMASYVPPPSPFGRVNPASLTMMSL